MATHSRGDNIVKSVSMTPDFWKDAEDRSNKLKFRSFSEYVRRLIEKDLAVRGSMIIAEEGDVSVKAPRRRQSPGGSLPKRKAS